jgi:hypothetical protein
MGGQGVGPLRAIDAIPASVILTQSGTTATGTLTFGAGTDDLNASTGASGRTISGHFEQDNNTYTRCGCRGATGPPLPCLGA